MNLLKSDRFWQAGGVLAALLLAALAWFVAIGPELSHASSLDSQTADAQSQNLVLQAKLHRLQRDDANLGTLTDSLRQARAALPVDTAIAAYTKQLTGYAAGSHVAVTGVSASAPVSATSKPGQAATASLGVPDGKLFALPLTVIVKGTAADDLRFVHSVQSDPRAALVTSVQLANDASGKSNTTQLTVQLQLWVQPESPEQLAALQKQLAGAGATTGS